jgi:pyridoxal phosphate enzyme (YggS family)
MTETIAERYSMVQEKMRAACKKVDRKEDDVKLLVVTKGFGAESIIQAVEAGATDLGENYPEETIRKINEIKKMRPEINPTWHMIGHLQSRKIKLMNPNFSMIHSIDSLDLAEKLDKHYREIGKCIDVLAEINIAGEDSKFGFDVSDKNKRNKFISDFERFTCFTQLRWIGLMTMPPYAIREGQNKEIYTICREMQMNIKESSALAPFIQLSMGTSADYEDAIECGATMVRVGEAIMGERIYPA